MANLLDITGNDIAALNDEDLRILVGKLCEADYRSAGLSLKGIKYGGHQDAPDGGLDVIVDNEISPPSNSHIPRNITGFQVKKTDMKKSVIIKEIKPNGVLRDKIKYLIQNSGAYIIVSSGASVTDTTLTKLINVMREVVKDEDVQNNLFLDYYDRGLITTWVNSHPSLILWIRNKIGRPLTGWRPYENWANAKGGIEEEFLLDDDIRLHDGTGNRQNGMSVKDGIENIRASLSISGASVRLTGLSGVGKTRFVQALFDERIGENALDCSKVYYTDTSFNPDPNPIYFSEQIKALNTRAILIVDNCPPELHDTLTKKCINSNVSLLTIEYDIRDDIPDETRVFRLEPSSEEIIYKLIRKRYSHISQIDARSIAEFSDGNARVGIALAETVEHGESLATLRNEELFKRLFWQRNAPDNNLMISAEACSLVYSFDGEDCESEKSELRFLSLIINKSVYDLYRDISTLKERNLIQSRGIWRAVLPQPVANKLAGHALESIPKDKLVSSFLYSGSERLIKSFSRRLSFLHESEKVVEIITDWLDKDGWLGKYICDLNSFGMEIFKNIAPVSPEKTLEAIERAADGNDGSESFTSRNNTHFYEFVRILRRIAYDAELFERCVKIMLRFALSESKDENSNSTRNVLKSLFYLYLSGTHAPLNARAKIIEDLLDSNEVNQQELGLFLLNAALEAVHFSSSHRFTFGARKRDYGYEPRTNKEIIQWYEKFIRICTRIAVSDQIVAQQARKILSNNLRGLWRIGLFDILESSIKQIHSNTEWSEGWITIRAIINYDGKGYNKEVLKRLYKLEKHLKPKTLLENARIFTLSGRYHYFDIEDAFDNENDVSYGWHHVEETAYKIGLDVAKDKDTFVQLLPDIVSTFNPHLYPLGRGLADGCESKYEIWKMLYDQLEKTPADKRQQNIFLGFLSACAQDDVDFFNSTLDNSINDDLLGPWFPLFQTLSKIDKRGIVRFHKALDSEKSKTGTFQFIGLGRAHESISDDDLADLLKKIILKEDGVSVAIEIIVMRFHSYKETIKYSDKLIAVGQEVLLQFPFSKDNRRHSHDDHELSQIARICLRGEEGCEATKKICSSLVEAIADYRIYDFNYPELLGVLAHVHPFVFLDAFLGTSKIKDSRGLIFSNLNEHFGNPINQISDKDIIAWCEQEPDKRYPLAASAIDPFTESEKSGACEWKPIVFKILEKAPMLKAVLRYFSYPYGIMPSVWSGSLADIIEKRSVLFVSLFDHKNPEIRTWAKNQHTTLNQVILNERKREEADKLGKYESFE